MQPGTPLPWEAIPVPGSYQRPVLIEDATGKLIAELSGNQLDPKGQSIREAEENASYLVHAANCLPALVTALERIADTIQGGDKLTSLEPWAKELVTQARAALALARKEGDK